MLLPCQNINPITLIQSIKQKGGKKMKGSNQHGKNSQQIEVADLLPKKNIQGGKARILFGMPLGMKNIGPSNPRRLHLVQK